MRFLRQFRNSFIFLAIILLIPFILLQVSAAAEQPRFPSELEAGSQDIRSANLEVAALLPVFRNDRHDPPPGDGPLFGVNFINSAEDLADEIQFPVSRHQSQSVLFVPQRDDQRLHGFFQRKPHSLRGKHCSLVLVIVLYHLKDSALSF